MTKRQLDAAGYVTSRGAGYRHSAEVEYTQQNVVGEAQNNKPQNSWTKERDEESADDDDDDMSMMSDVSETGVQAVLQK